MVYRVIVGGFAAAGVMGAVLCAPAEAAGFNSYVAEFL
jgi:hypothetical protein